MITIMNMTIVTVIAKMTVIATITKIVIRARSVTKNLKRKEIVVNQTIFQIVTDVVKNVCFLTVPIVG